jgi:hypothetical protein
MCFDSDETGKFLESFPVFILLSKFLDAFVQPFKLIAEGCVSQQVFVEDFFIQSLMFFASTFS